MSELTREEKLKLLEKLPERLQDFLYSEDTGAFLLYLGNKYKLPDEKVRLLSKLVGDIILGITPVTNLAQEINSKITGDLQASMHMAQELYAELLAPVMTETKQVAPSAPVAPVTQPASPLQIPSQPPIQPPVAPVTKPQIPDTRYQIPSTDQYRESIREAPEIVDLRKTPPSPAEAGYGGQRPPVAREGGLPPGLPISAAPAYIPEEISAGKPLTFTKPIEKPLEPPKPIPTPIPLIEAEPHLPAKISPEISAGKITPSPVPAPQPPAPKIEIQPPASPRPQYIIRPPGLAPTPTLKVGAPIPVERGVGADMPHDVLDLRKDKGEF